MSESENFAWVQEGTGKPLETISEVLSHSEQLRQSVPKVNGKLVDPFTTLRIHKPVSVPSIGVGAGSTGSLPKNTAVLQKATASSNASQFRHPVNVGALGLESLSSTGTSNLLGSSLLRKTLTTQGDLHSSSLTRGQTST